MQCHFSFTGMVLHRLLGRKYLSTVNTVVGESVLEGACFQCGCAAHIGFGRVEEGVTEPTTGYPIFIQSYEAIKVLRLFFITTGK